MGTINQPSPFVRLTRQEAWVDGFWREHGSFAACADEQLRIHLRTYYPDGIIAPGFVQALFRAVLQRLIDGHLPDYDADLHGTLSWSGHPDPDEPDERYSTLLQVIEGVASGLVGDYKQGLWNRWAARPSSLDASHGVGLVFRQRLEAHCAAIDALFQPLSLAQFDPLELALRIEEAEAHWRESFRAGGGLSGEERSLIERLTRSALGDWLSGLGEEDLAMLQRFQQRAALVQDQARRLLANMASLSTYAGHCLEEAVRAEFGIEVDSAVLQVLTEQVRDGVPLSRTTTLAQLVAEGPFLPSEKKPRRLLDAPDNLGALLTPEVLDRLLERLDVRTGYQAKIRALYRSPELDAVLTELYDIRLQQSAFIARCRGHLSPEGYARVVHAVEHDGDGVAGVSLFPDLLLAGPLVFFDRDEAGTAHSLLLYAPDKPDGQEWIELASLRHVAIELVQWLDSEAGRTWLLGMINGVDQVRAEQFFVEVAEQSDRWDSGRDHRGPLRGYRLCVSQMIAIRQAIHLYWIDFNDAPRWFCELPLEKRRLIAGINEDLRLLDEAAQHRMGERETWQAFARRTVKADIATYLRSKGISEEVEPDTILFDFIPGLSGYGTRHARSLLDLALYGYDDNWGLDDPDRRVRSSVGQDLSTLRAADLTQYVRRAYLGDRYASTLRERFLDAGAPDYESRRWLFAQLTATTMFRDVQVAHAKRMVDAEQLRALSAVIGAVSRAQPAGQGEMRRLAINGRPAIGLYVLRVEVSGEIEEWLYTPLAPDGQTFRRYSSFRGARLGSLHTYYLGRLRLNDRNAASTYLSLLAERKEQRRAADTFFLITDLRDEYNDYLQSHIDDVEAVSQSRHEVIMSLVTKGLAYAALPLCLAFPPLGIALDVTFALVAAERAIKAEEDDDSAAALQQWVSVMASLWGIALPLGWAGFRAAVWGSSPQRAPLSALRDPVSPQPRHALGEAPVYLDRSKALRRAPDNLCAMEAGGLWRGVYTSTEPGSRLHYVRQNGRWFQVVHDVDNNTLRLVDARFPNAAYKLPIRQDGWGRWVHNRQVGLPGGSNDVRYLGRVSRVAQAFPDRANPVPARGALQGEGVIARFRPGAGDNYLYSLNAETCVVVTLYNPGARMGAVIHVDHNIQAVVQRALDDALQRIGHARGDGLKATLVGGDWLSGGADIGGPVKSLLARQGITASWDHWSWSSCLGNTYGVSLDLADGATTVFTTTRSAVRQVVDPVLREASSGAVSVMGERGRRFMARFRQEPLVQRADGSVRTAGGELASPALIDGQALAMHLLTE